MNLKIKRKINLKVHYVQGSIIWASKDYSLYKSKDLGNTWKKQGTIKVSFWKKILNKIRILKRLFRLGILNVLVLSQEEIIITTRNYLYKKKGKKIKKVHKFKYRNPLQQGITKDSQGNIYYGEYWTNPKRKKVTIYKSTDQGKSWKEFYSFPPKEIRHIHFIKYDTYSGLLWIGTGDQNKESKILTINPKNKEIKIIGEGRQDWRAVSLIFTEKNIYWGTDDPSNNNFIYCYNRESEKKEIVQKSNNPFYYSFKTKDFLFFATTVEKKKNNWSKIFISSNGKKWHSLLKFKKDFLPYIFSYGKIQFPLGETLRNNLIFTPIGVKSFDGVSLIGLIQNDQ